MGASPAARLNARTLLRLGRVSNLPTVWTNALAGSVLATGASVAAGPVLTAALILSLFYVGGMWLNDAFDAEIDAAERSARPIPSGEIGRRTVFAVGGGLLALGVLAGFGFGTAPGIAALALAGAVLLYDWVHKRSVLSPVIMGVTRFFCYVFGALAVGALPWPVLAGALGLFAYVVGLTYAAKQEAYDRIGRAWPLAVLALPLVIAVAFAASSALHLRRAGGCDGGGAAASVSPGERGRAEGRGNADRRHLPLRCRADGLRRTSRPGPAGRGGVRPDLASPAGRTGHLSARNPPAPPRLTNEE